MNSGIYEIVSPSGKRYIGSAVNIARRWRQHRSDLRLGRHGSQALQRAFRKYGESNLTYRILISCDPKHCIFFEERAINHLHPDYNSSPHAGSRLGIRSSLESRVKMSQSALGRLASPETRAKMAEAQRRRRSTSQVSAETRRKLSLAMKRAGHRPPREAIERAVRTNQTRIRTAEERMAHSQIMTAW